KRSPPVRRRAPASARYRLLTPYLVRPGYFVRPGAPTRVRLLPASACSHPRTPADAVVDRLLFSGAGGGIRTRTGTDGPEDFKSAVSAIPPLRRGVKRLYLGKDACVKLDQDRCLAGSEG